MDPIRVQVPLAPGGDAVAISTLGLALVVACSGLAAAVWHMWRFARTHGQKQV